MTMNRRNNNHPALTCPSCTDVRLEKVPTPGWFIVVSILLLGIPYLVKREQYICPNCKKIHYKEPEKFEWSGRLQAIIVIIILFAILILIEQLLNRLFNH